MKVVIHIGTEKTGTSSIQEFLLQNKTELAKQGFSYLHMNGRNEYRDFPAYCSKIDRVDLYFLGKGVTDRESRVKFDENFLSSYRQSIAELPKHIHTVIISSEHFSFCLETSDEVNRLKSLLAQNFSSVQVVCYLRDQVAKVCSAYSTYIKTDGLATFDEFFNNYIDIDKSSRDEYDGKLDLWAEAFGFEKINVRLFKRGNFSGESLLSDFCSVLGETLFDRLNVPVQQHNEALSRRGCEVLRHLNYLFPTCIRGRVSVEDTRVSIIGMIARYVKGEPVKLTSEQTQQRFGPSNERTRERYFPDRPDLFGNKT